MSRQNQAGRLSVLTLVWTTIFLLAAVIQAPVSASAASAAPAAQKSAAPTITVVIDGKPLQLSAAPLMYKGSLLLPMKSILDALGVKAAVQLGRIDMTRGSTKWTIRLNTTMLQTSNQNIRLSQAPIILNGRIYVSARLVAIVSGKNVNYDTKQKKVVIGYSEADLKVFQRTLFEAAMSGDAVTIERMLDRGVDPNLKLVNMFGDNVPIEYAVMKSSTEGTRALLEHGADVKLSSRDLVSEAILNQNADLLDLLLSHGYDANKTNRDGYSYLESASGVIGRSSNGSNYVNQYPKAEIVQTLLAHGADPGLDSSLYTAVQWSSYPIAQLLLKAGADPYKENRFHDTPYKMAVSRGTTKWLVVQDKQPVIPELRIMDAQGVPVESGTIFIQSAEGRYDLDRWVNWEGRTAYAELPDGNYNIVSARTYRTTSVLNKPIRVQNGQFESATLQLQKPNVTGTASFENASVNRSGQLNIYNDRNSYICDVVLNNGKFELSLPPGTYSFGQYFDFNGDTYAAKGTISVPAEGSISANVTVSATKYVYPQG
ncbi:stalk domain-containing protein [Paenibacillus sp. CF384]|uniref:stalk domain-containing protein n=1 Tax=Paenibacillus sp. CF384 TaxID=1884382 RepID=UPI000895D043|nr:stalk domain-containing protein [Paenibacillus sp. CF384]SDW78907.1 Copper amine oxidase N-terminal domain-containing protein [Paenibacillus sp. CF384]